MKYNVKSIKVFERQAKKLINKYPSLKSELSELIQKLKTNPNQGIPLGKSCYKIRLAIKSKNKGKSGGARIITHFFVSKNSIYPSLVDACSIDAICSSNVTFKINTRVACSGLFSVSSV